jgi:transketolase
VIVPVHGGHRGHRHDMSSKATSLPPSLAELRELGQQLRVDSIRASDVKKSGHPTSAMSAADLMAVLFAKYLRYDFDQPEHRLNDHLIFSKGHASPLLSRST